MIYPELTTIGESKQRAPVEASRIISIALSLGVQLHLNEVNSCTTRVGAEVNLIDTGLKVANDVTRLTICRF